MTLTLYNTLTRRKEEFRPIDPENVRMYVCGPTVYDYAHIGNARPVIVFDVLFRLLRYLYGAEHVTYARNITDVDDKINARAAEEYPQLPLNEAIRKVTSKTERQFQADIAALGVLPPTVEPRATEHIAEMRALIDSLVANRHAYVAEGHVLFDVSSMRDYGRLANRSLEEMEAGARVDVAPYKKGPMDFVLWKPSKPGEPGWDSPAGIAVKGRPGWHIECSAMADKWLWREAEGRLSALGLAHPHVFDIHGGGIDLVFPHHENEIAQSRCGHRTAAMANYWMHNGFLQVEGEKMSKSLGNFVTIHELLGEWTGSVVRYTMLQTHYNQPIDWTVDKLERSRTELGLWAGLYSGSEAHHDYQDRKYRRIPPTPSRELVDALSDNVNTPKAIAILRKQFSDRSAADGLGKEFFQNCEFLGLIDPERVGSLEAEHATGSVLPQLLFAAFPALLRLRAGAANSRTDVVERATRELREIGVAPRDMKEGFFELEPLSKAAELDKGAIEELIAARHAARKAKDFKEADRIRDELSAMGIHLKEVRDPATGEITTTWEVRASGATEVKR